MTCNGNARKGLELCREHREPVSRKRRGASIQRQAAGLLVIALCGGCDTDARVPPGREATVRPVHAASEDAAWLLSGSTDERFERVAKHLRGFDVAMMETAYRYGELYWAGQDGNWDYADYQLKKLETAVANGVERRPRRASSARMLVGAVEQVRAAIHQRTAGQFETAYSMLTVTCNACHQAEGVPFIRAQPPTVRDSIVRGAAPLQ